MDQGAGRRRHRRPRAFYQGLIRDLEEFARGEFLLGSRQKDGSTLRDNLLSVFKQTGVRPRQLDTEDCPSVMKYIWDWFLELQEERGVDDMGRPLEFSSEKLLSWSRLQRVQLTAFELEAIKRLDRLFTSQKFEKEEEPHDH